MKTFKEMLKVEFILSIRDMNMVIFAILMPVVIMFLIGSIYSGNNGSTEMISRSFSAVSTVGICAGGLMGLPLVVADYRQKKILKRLQVTPISPLLILIVQVAIYIIYAVASLILVYLLATIFFGYQMQGPLWQFLGYYVLVMASMFSIGMMVGGLSANMKTASLITSLLYFPMLVFSGTTLPYEIMPTSLQKIADFLPLTQGIKLLEAVSLNMEISNMFPILIMVAIIIVCTTLSIKLFKWE
ncbi:MULTISPECIES: ABC transporter permease [unclassified Breznakia]|uniref:ABC transporter permease n=1 Tax=unclassified Breznakia TaxID=2623764 RepID=UPI0024068EA6|nr:MULTISPECIES: ABC transporter permease [unclassified Breznakia]